MCVFFGGGGVGGATVKIVMDWGHLYLRIKSSCSPNSGEKTGSSLASLVSLEQVTRECVYSWPSP